MKRPEAIAIMEYFAGKSNTAGSTTSLIHGYNSWATFIVKEARDTLEVAHGWRIPGLFITNDEVMAANRPSITFFYRMGCGRILATVIPRIVIDNRIKIPNNFVVLGRDSIFKGDIGFYLHFDAWNEIGNMNDYLIKKSSADKLFLVRRVPAVRKV